MLSSKTPLNHLLGFFPSVNAPADFVVRPLGRSSVYTMFVGFRRFILAPVCTAFLFSFPV